MQEDVAESQWWLDLLADANYNSLDLEGEAKAYQRYCDEAEKVPTRIGFLSWLKRAEPPMKTGRKPKAPPDFNIYMESKGWREALSPEMTEHDRWILEQPWEKIRCIYGRKIHLAMWSREGSAAEARR